MASPLEEFEIHPLTGPIFSLGSHPISLTNSAFFMFLAIILATALMVLAMRPQALVPGRWQMLAEKLYNAISDMMDSTAGEKARPFFPFIFTIFLFILFCNLLGMLPWSLAVTSHIIINLAIALTLFAIILLTGFIRNGLHFFELFIPPGLPWYMAVFIVPIEIVSFLVRPFSLSLRLFANMLAGHILLAVFAGMAAALLTASWGMAVIGILPLGFNIAMTGFEFFVAVLQAYIYAILASVYLRDALEMH